MVGMRIGATNSLHDVAGLRVGHADRSDEGWLTGTTLVLAPAGGATSGVDVRGGGPGTRETDLLDPRNMVERVHAIVLTGGSAYGLASADGVMHALEADGIGFPVGDGLVPIVPAAVIFDLGRGGDFAARPDATFGADAYAAALAADPTAPVATGCVGAGTGAKAGGLKGGVGSASAVLDDGTTVAALAVVNAAGSAVDPSTGELYAARFGLEGEFASLLRPAPAELEEARARGDESAQFPTSYAMATTIGVVATDVSLTKAQCQKLAGIAHDGMARAISPVHTMFDGDTVFALATGDRNPPDPIGFHDVLMAASDAFTRAIGHALLDATSTMTASHGLLRCYWDAFPSAVDERMDERERR